MLIEILFDNVDQITTKGNEKNARVLSVMFSLVYYLHNFPMRSLLYK